jgi:ABC-2 type transport system ATP-binding protein
LRRHTLGDEVIEVAGLVKRYGSFDAVKGVDFTVGDGKVVGLLGPNGAGKTTIMKVLTGYHRPSEGRAILDGKDVAIDPVGVKSIVGYLPEGVPLYLDMTVREYLDFVVEARGMPNTTRTSSIERAITSCGLSGVHGVRIERLSKGFRQRVGLAQAIVHDPHILILDEPTTGLDPNQILEIRSLIRSLGSSKTVILSTHILQEVEALCSEVLILNEGRIVAQGSASEIAASMQGEERIECRIKGELHHGMARLRAATGIQSAELTGKDSGGVENLRVVAAYGNGDIAAESVFDWAAGEGFKLLEMRRQRLSMEDIFVRLTTEEEGR